MALVNLQLSNTPGATDYPFMNYGSSDIDEGVAVAVDAANALGTAGVGVGVIVPAADGDVVIGVTMEKIPAGKQGRVRCFGPLAAMKADGAITAGAYVMASGTVTKKGFAKAAGAAAAGLGIALNVAAADNDLVLVMLLGAKNA